MRIYDAWDKLFFYFSGMRKHDHEIVIGKNKDGVPFAKIGNQLIDKDHPVTPPTPPVPPEPPVEEFVAKIGDTKYDTLEAAVEAAVDGDLIELGKDAEGAGIGLWVATPKSITIDLGGFTYNAIGPAVGSVGTLTQAFHLEQGSTVVIKNGKITASPVAESNVKMMIQNYCDLTLDNVEVVANDGSTYVVSNNYGTFTCNDSTLTGPVAFDVWFGNKSQFRDKGVSVTINSGEINGKVEYGAKAASSTAVPDWMDKTILTINGGKFNGEFSEQYDKEAYGKANVTVPADVKDDPSKYFADDTTWKQFWEESPVPETVSTIDLFIEHYGSDNMNRYESWKELNGLEIDCVTPDLVESLIWPPVEELEPRE